MSAEPVGSLAEEAAKLIAALQGWAQEQMQRPGTDGSGSATTDSDQARSDQAGSDQAGSDQAGSDEAPSDPADKADGGPSIGSNATMTDDHLGHHDPLAPECRYCPLCAFARMAKATTPEVRDHLANAALSMALAVKGLLDANVRPPSTSTPVEKIDLAED